MFIAPATSHRRAKALPVFILGLTLQLSLNAAPGETVRNLNWVEAILALTTNTTPAEAASAWQRLAQRHPQPCDWMQQDFKTSAWTWLSRPDKATVRKMIAHVREELGQSNDVQKAEPAAPRDLPGLLTAYVELCETRRARRLQGPQEHLPGIIFTKHHNLGGSHYAYAEGQSDAQNERHFDPGSALCLLTWKAGSPEEITLLEDPRGVIRDPDVSYDGQRVLFAWKKSDRKDDYHLYEMTLATREIRQLTQGLGAADYEGVYLPNGDILFNSTRCVQTVDCWWTEVSNLYRCDGNGGNLRRVTVDQVHDNFPTVTGDGRILYTRWEYNDRSQIFPQPLMQMMADGTGQTAFYGGNSWFPTTLLHARNIPQTQKVIAIATGHHTLQAGKLILLDPELGREENQGAQLIAPVRQTRAERIDAYGQAGELFQYPYPLSEIEYLVTYHPVGWQDGRPSANTPRFGLYWMAIDGRRELLASDPELSCNQSIPLRARSLPPVRHNQIDYQKTEGTLYVQDVYAGASMHGVDRGAIKKLRVVALDFRAAGIGNNGNAGPGGGALISTPVAIGNGTWDPKTILGEATVHPDGSVFVTVPARKAIYFQLLDGNGRMVQSMRSWTSLQPGENASCVGCHENKNTAPTPLPHPTQALLAGAETLKPVQSPARGFSFTREIQPILNAKCLSCHDGQKQLTNGLLTATEIVDPLAKRRWTQSYLTLTHARPDRGAPDEPAAWRGDPDHPLVNWISAASVPTALPPYSAGANRSGLIHDLELGHHDVKLTAAELNAFATWIDLGVPFCGDYVEANAWSEPEKAKYDHFLAKRAQLAREPGRR
jgi:hypothetical protein